MGQVVLTDHAKQIAIRTGVLLPTKAVERMSWHAQDRYYRRLRVYAARQERDLSDDIVLYVDTDHRWDWENESIQDSWDNYIDKNARARKTYAHRMSALRTMATGT